MSSINEYEEYVEDYVIDTAKLAPKVLWYFVVSFVLFFGLSFLNAKMENKAQEEKKKE
jgi:large-conductance mechanosensitive channel